MLRRGGPLENVDAQHTYGHNLLTEEQVQKVAEHATHWAVIQRYEDTEEVFTYNLFKKEGLVSLFQQGKLHRATLIAGLRVPRAPKEPVPGCFFRTLDFLLQFVAGGNSYRAITDKELAKGFPPAAWCRPPVVSGREDAEAMTAAALEGVGAEDLARAPATDPVRLFYACRSWCYIHAYNTPAASVRMAAGVAPAELYNKYCEGLLSEYLPMVGMMEEAPLGSTYTPPSVMLPLGALLYMHEHGRPYLPLTLSELRDVRNGGIMSIAVRPGARPMRLPPGVWPVGVSEVDLSATAPPLGVEPYLGPAASGRAAGGGGGGGGGASTPRSHQINRQDSPTPSRVDRKAGASLAGGGSAATATRPPDLEPDPILDDSSRWIMPKPFDAPKPILPSSSMAGLTAVTVADDDDDARSVANDGDAVAAAPAAAAATTSALPPSPFLQYNAGVQPSYETPPLRLFLGDRSQSGLTGNWWYVDSETKDIKGPYSPEAMMLSCITPCREIHDETLLCGTEADVRPPMLPPLAAFRPLGQLLRDVGEGVYALVSRVEIVSPLARSFLGNRIRLPKPEPQPLATATTAVQPAPATVVIAVQAQQQQPTTATSGAATAATAAVQNVTAVSASQLQQPPIPVQLLAAAPAQLQAPPLPQPPSLQPPQQQAPPTVQQQQQPQAQQLLVGQQQQPVYVSASMAVPMQSAMKGLPHPMTARPQPVTLPAVAAAAVPAYTLPGSVVYMPQYGHAVHYSGQAVMAQPVFGNLIMQPAAMAQVPQPQQQR